MWLYAKYLSCLLLVNSMIICVKEIPRKDEVLSKTLAALFHTWTLVHLNIISLIYLSNIINSPVSLILTPQLNLLLHNEHILELTLESGSFCLLNITGLFGSWSQVCHSFVPYPVKLF